MRSWLALATALTGCGRIGFGAVPDGPCVLGPWSDVRPIPELAGGGSSGGQILPDGLTLYFDSDRSGDEEIYVAHRPDRISPFDPPLHLAELGTPGSEADASLTGDELEMFFQRDAMTILRTTRTTTTAMWDPPHVVAFPQAVTGPDVSLDGLTLFYNTPLDLLTEGEIYMTTRATRSDPFEPGVPVPALTGMPNRGFPSLSPDGLLLLFEVESGPGGVTELWQTTRASPGDAFEAPERISELASGNGETDASITADLRELFFASGVNIGMPTLYVASRDCL